MPTFSQRIIGGLAGAFSGIKRAWMAGYNAAAPNRVQAQATRMGTNPNSTWAQMQRQTLSLEGENAIKNTSFAINYICKRIMYCSGSISYAPDTGDHALDEKVLTYLNQKWAHMGVGGCSMQDSFSRVADVFLVEKGDAALQFFRDADDELRVMEITADRIGSIYQFTRPEFNQQTGETYFQGVYFKDQDITGFRIFDRSDASMYYNPHRVEAHDMLFFKDDITGGVRGVSKFFAALRSVNSKYQILKSTMDTMQQQSKNAAIGFNNSGAPADYTYETQLGQQGQIEYVQTYADGAVERYMFNGDSYQVLKAGHPTDALINGMKYVDADSCRAVGMPYGFLMSGQESGGAPFRGDFEIAGKEITRIRERVHRPKLNVIAYLTIMDAVEKGRLPAVPNIARGAWSFGTLPSVDAFRDDKSDIMAIRAGISTRNEVTVRNSNRPFAVVLRESGHEAYAIAKEAQEANRRLKAEGYDPTVTVNDIAQNSDNPQQSAEAGQIDRGKAVVTPSGKVSDAPVKAAA